MSVTSINGLLLKRMIISGANSLNSKKDTVDSLNVFPVPDGDTGTNMSLTAVSYTHLYTVTIQSMRRFP